jgi:3-oxoadipate enol-lactonase
VPNVNVGDISLYYERGGSPSGPPVLFINGTGGDLRDEPSIFASPLGRDFDLLAYDQRGLGRSDKPDVAYSMADYGRDAVALLDVVGWDRCSVVGVSFGGMVAQELALLAPHRVSKLALCCTSSGGSGGASYPLHELADLPEDERSRRSMSLIDSRWDDDWQAAHPEIIALLRERGKAGAGDPAAVKGARRQLEARAGHDTYERLPQLSMPVLVCAGRYDLIAPLANSEAIVAQIPNATLSVFDGGHAFLFQDPTAWRAIVTFLAGNGRPEARVSPSARR